MAGKVIVTTMPVGTRITAANGLTFVKRANGQWYLADATDAIIVTYSNYIWSPHKQPTVTAIDTSYDMFRTETP